MNTYFKIQHWLLFLLFLFLGVSSILELTVFHYSTIIPNLEFAYGVNEIQSGKASQVFIARTIRGELWDLHYYAGLIFAFLLLISVIHIMKRTKKFKVLNLSFIAITIVLLVTGVARYFRGSLSFMSEGDKFWRHLLQDVHHYSAYIITILIISHIGYMIYLENKKIKGIISNMFTPGDFKLKILLAGVLALSTNYQVQANAIKYDSTIVISKKIQNIKDMNYAKALEYYNGIKGFDMEERSFPNCPYDACTQDSRSIKSFSKDGRTYYTIKIHNFKKAKEFFDKSVEVSKNPLSAEKNLIMILERINYKDKILDDYLLEEINKTLALKSKKEIMMEIYKNAQLIGEKNSPKIIYKVAEIFEQGYMGIPKNSIKAKKLYKVAIKKAKKNSLYYLLATNKVK